MNGNWIIIILCAVCISAMLTAFIIPRVLQIAHLKKLFDNPDYRKIHKGVVPRLGGVAFLPALICSLSVVVGFVVLLKPSIILNRYVGTELPPLLVLFTSITLLYLIGLKDDLISVKYGAKFIFQGICSILTVFSGVCLLNLHGLLWINDISLVPALLLSIILIIVIINSINLLDGIDGLASGIGIITLVLYGVIFFIAGEFIYSMISWVMTASVGIFFLYNFFGNDTNKKKLFMGDVGSLTMGMVIAALSLEIAELEPQAGNSLNPTILAFSPLIIPIFDLIRVFIFRLCQKRSPFLPDKCHIHHLIINAGFSPHQSLLFIILLQILIIVLNIALEAILNINIILAIDVVLYVVFIMLMTRKTSRSIDNA